MKKPKKKPNWFKDKNELIIFLISFAIALGFFLWQRRFFSWDFSVYMMNAEYALGLSNGYGNYFEWLRAPVVPLVLMVFRPFGRAFASYAFVVFCTCFYFFSLKLFHNKFLKKIENSELFYLFMINPFVLFYGVYAGSELISLSLIILFVVFAFSTSSFFLLGLSMLTRYSNIFLLPLVFVSKNIKKILIGLGILVLVFLFWFFINYIFTGNALTSIMDYYALNVIGRKGSVFTTHIVRDLLFSTNITLPFFVLGIIFIFFKKNDKKTIRNNIIREKIFWLMMIFLVLTLATYFWASLKLERFLFNLTLPIAYFSIFGFNFLASLFKNRKNNQKRKKENNKKKEERVKGLFFVIVCILILISLLTFCFADYSYSSMEFRHIKKISDKLDNCMVSSNKWVYFNYFGKPAYYPPRSSLRTDLNKTDFSVKIDEGYNIIIFKDRGNEENYLELEPLIKNLSADLINEDNEEYIWIRNKSNCKESFIINDSYIERTSKLEGWKWLEELL